MFRVQNQFSSIKSFRVMLLIPTDNMFEPFIYKRLNKTERTKNVFIIDPTMTFSFKAQNFVVTNVNMPHFSSSSSMTKKHK